MKQGNKREENIGEHRRTSPGESRMRYHKRQGHQSSLSLLHAESRVNKIIYSGMPGTILL